MLLSGHRLTDMTEDELANYYYQHRDELAGEEVFLQGPVRLEEMFGVRLASTDADLVRAAAQRAQMSVPAYIRQVVLNAAWDEVIYPLA
jgi:hypothetical protein